MRARSLVVGLALCACSTPTPVDPPVPLPPFHPPAAPPDASPSCGNTANDPHNCGVCGHECHGTYCAAGMCAPIELAQGKWTPNLVVVNDGYVYWTAAGGQVSVLRAPVSGAAAEPIALGDNAWGLAVDATTVYYTTMNVGGGGSVRSVPKAGGMPTTLATDKNNTPMELTLVGDTLYWTTESGNGGGVMAMPINGSPTKLSAPMVTRNATGLAVSSTTAYVTWVGSFSTPSTVSSIALDGGAETVFAGPLDHPQTIVLDGQVLFWSEFGATFGGHTTLQAAWTDGTNTQTMTTGHDAINRIAVDANDVYWTYYLAGGGLYGGVRAMSRGGSAQVFELARDQQNLTGLAVDDTAIYVAVHGGASLALGQILKLSKL